ncbi:MAG TPA: hypothetical protein VFO07_09230, partial [Roseiflexaceae bacterium]|nr:hypothetical protein [Roseiflexaceae bacterium]
MMINVLVWLLFGLLAGALASRLTQTISPTTIVLNSIAGTMGAVVGGIIFLIFDTTPLDTLSRGGILCALIGAMLVIVLVRIMFRRPI